MNRITGRWKMPFALLVTLSLAWAAWVEVGVRFASAGPRIEMLAPGTHVPDGPPASNEIQDYQQLD